MFGFLRWSGLFAFGSAISYSQLCFDVSRHKTRLVKSSVKIAQRQIVINMERFSRCPPSSQYPSDKECNDYSV
jgi:hypothetical protein